MSNLCSEIKNISWKADQVQEFNRDCFNPIQFFYDNAPTLK